MSIAATFGGRFALTMGEQSEIHVGTKIYGSGLAKEGFTVQELQDIAEKFGDNAQITYLSNGLPAKYRKDTSNDAAVLVIKDGINLIMEEVDYADRMLKEQQSISYDKSYWDNRRKKKLNKQARWNAVFGDKHIEPSEDYQQSTVIAYDEVPLFAAFRAKIPDVAGPKAQSLESEGNHYYEAKSGIGFHGDSGQFNKKRNKQIKK